MKNFTRLSYLLIFLIISQVSFGQNQDAKFKLEGTNPKTIEWNREYSEYTEISPFNKNINLIYGLAVNASIQVEDQNDFSVNLVLIDNYGNEHLIYDCNELLESSSTFQVDNLSEETCILNGVRPDFIQIETKNATVTINNFTYTTGVKAGWDIAKVWNEKKQAQDEDKIARINQRIKEKGLHWVAGSTSVSEMSYSERKKLYGQSTFPSGFEFYCGGVISAGSTNTTKSTLKSATANKSIC